MEYLPGVPLSGSKGISSNNDVSQRRIGANDYIISEIDIAIYIEQSLATGSNEKMIESASKINPGKRITIPEDVADIINLIGLSENTWLTGNTIRVDGGEDITG